MATTDVMGETSAEIFAGQRTLPQIRAIHASLHSQVEEKSLHLRRRVGSSYRELLGTADSIVQMRGDNNQVQHLLANMGSRCGRTVVTDKAGNLGEFWSKQSKTNAASAAHLKLLESCALVVDRCLKSSSGLGQTIAIGDRLTMAAKILTLGRLLTASIGGDINLDLATQQSLTLTVKALEKLRWKLRRGIDRVLEKPSEDADRENITKALCAKSLVSSSGAKDALRYFLDIRTKAIQSAFESAAETGSGLKRTQDNNSAATHALTLYIRTILDVQALLPTLLPQALSALKQNRLLDDPALNQLDILRLDLYERWCTEDIQLFTPYIRHDDLDGKAARDSLGAWAEAGAQALIAGLKQSLEAMSDFKSITTLRTSILTIWIRNGSKAKGFDPQELQDDIREAINSRLLAVLEAKVMKLRLVGSEISATIEGWENGVTDKQAHLWDYNGYDEALEQGAAPFLQDVLSRLNGRNNTVSKAINSYISWYHVIDHVKAVVEELKRQRWDNDFDEVEDEEIIDTRQLVLSKEDPKMLQDQLDATLDKGYQALGKQLADLWAANADQEENASAIAAYLVRVIRDIRVKLPDRSSVKEFGLDIVTALHESIASGATISALETFTTTGLSSRVVVCRPLWDGQPPLPNQPSPSLFKFIDDLSYTMSNLGADLWTPAATTIMKRQLAEHLSKAWQRELSELKLATSSTTKTDGVKLANADSAASSVDAKVTPEEEVDNDTANEEAAPDSDITAETSNNSQELCIQWLFDIYFLCSCLGAPAKAQLEELSKEIYRRTELDDESARKRIIKAAEDYWQRVSLLFGLFA